VTSSSPDFPPDDDGLNTTLTMHDPRGASFAVQVFDVVVKSAALVPPTLTETTPLVAPPLLVTVKVEELDCPVGTVPKSCKVGAIPSAAGATPVPESRAGALPPGVALAVSVADLAPDADGLNTTATAHEARAASALP